MKKTLYRLIWGHDYKKGTPCIPGIPLGTIGEDESQERICVSETISGCLSSIGAGYIGELGITTVIERIRQSDPNGKLDMEKVWRSTTFPFTILEFLVDAEDPNVLNPQQISGKVFDALITGEHWILNERVPDRVRKVWLYDATLDDVVVTLSNGKRSRYVLFSYDKWEKKKRNPDIRFLKGINLAFVKTMKQFEKQGYS